MNSILVVAHSPIASALRQGVLHMFPDCGQCIAALDIDAGAQVEDSLALARVALERLLACARGPGVMLAADVIGATPCNVARRLADGQQRRLVAGVNLPMLMRAMTYRQEPIETMIERAIEGANRGVVMVAPAGSADLVEAAS